MIASPLGKLHPVPTAILIVTTISIRTHSVRHLVSIGNRFPWLYINCFQSPWFQCIIIESGIFLWWMSKGGREGGRCMFLKKEGGISRRGKMKKEMGPDTPFRTMEQIMNTSTRPVESVILRERWEHPRLKDPVKSWTYKCKHGLSDR